MRWHRIRYSVVAVPGMKEAGRRSLTFTKGCGGWMMLVEEVKWRGSRRRRRNILVRLYTVPSSLEVMQYSNHVSVRR